MVSGAGEMQKWLNSIYCQNLIMKPDVRHVACHSSICPKGRRGGSTSKMNPRKAGEGDSKKAFFRNLKKISF